MSDPALKQLMDQFVCVRLVQMGGVDLSIYQFDPFLSWSVMFLHADKTIYGRYGTAHPQAKRSRKDSNTNHTLEGLRAALRGGGSRPTLRQSCSSCVRDARYEDSSSRPSRCSRSSSTQAARNSRAFSSRKEGRP